MSDLHLDCNSPIQSCPTTEEHSSSQVTITASHSSQVIVGGSTEKGNVHHLSPQYGCRAGKQGSLLALRHLFSLYEGLCLRPCGLIQMLGTGSESCYQSCSPPLQNTILPHMERLHLWDVCGLCCHGTALEPAVIPPALYGTLWCLVQHQHKQYVHTAHVGGLWTGP